MILVKMVVLSWPIFSDAFHFYFNLKDGMFSVYLDGDHPSNMQKSI